MSRAVRVGNIVIGGGAPVTIQSMTNVDTHDYDALLAQVTELESVGCQIIRVAVTDDACVKVISRLVNATKTPIVADIQYDYRLAIACCDAGVAKIRINPGNIGSSQRIAEVVRSATANRTAIRVGANSGSLLYRDIEPVEALVRSTLDSARVLLDVGFEDIVLSLKSSSVSQTVEAARRVASLVDLPQHLGVTESGVGQMALVKSSIGIGSLLLDGIGDTIRVSLSANPTDEVIAAEQILRSVGLRRDFVNVVSCPTCSRCSYNLFELAQTVEQMSRLCRKRLKIAVMGCAVNGIGESADADLGIAGGTENCVIFSHGKKLATVKTELAHEAFIAEVKKLIE